VAGKLLILSLRPEYPAAAPPHGPGQVVGRIAAAVRVGNPSPDVVARRSPDINFDGTGARPWLTAQPGPAPAARAQSACIDEETFSR